MLMEKVNQAATAPFRDVLVVVTSTKADEAALIVGEQLAVAPLAHGTALLATPLPSAFFSDDGFGGAATSATILAMLREGGAKEHKILSARLAQNDVIKDVRSTEVESFISRTTVMVSARHADLTIFTLPSATQGPFQLDLIQAALFGAGRPLLLVPQNWRRGGVFRRVLVAWNGSRESARAVADAAPFLEGAGMVVVATVDADPSLTGVSEAPGEDISVHLARHGVNVELRNVGGAGRSEGQNILDVAHQMDADLIVLGGYGHSRMREMVFGGVTKELLHTSDIPLFMSH